MSDAVERLIGEIVAYGNDREDAGMLSGQGRSGVVAHKAAYAKLTELRTALAESLGGWMVIDDEARKPGKPFLVAGPDWYMPALATWQGQWGWCSLQGSRHYENQPTHYQPIPQLPDATP